MFGNTTDSNNGFNGPQPGGGRGDPGRQYYEMYKNRRRDNTMVLRRISWAAGCSFLGFYLISKLFGTVAGKFPAFVELYDGNMDFQLAFDTAFIVVSLLLPFWLSYRIIRANGTTDAALPLGRPYRNSYMPLLIIAGWAACIIGSYATSYLSQYVEYIFNVQFSYDDYSVPADTMGVVLYYVRIALVPALIEETCLRGFIMQPLRKYGDWFAIIMSSMVFALMHGNMIQIPFAFIAGIAIGYAVTVTGSMWTGVCIHFLNNLLSATLSLILSRSGEHAAMLFSVSATAIVLAAGVIAMIYYLLKKPQAFRLYPTQVDTSSRAGSYIFTLPMLVSIGVLVHVTIGYISGS